MFGFATNNERLQLGNVHTYQHTGTHISQVVFGQALEIHMSCLPPLGMERILERARYSMNKTFEKWCVDIGRLDRGIKTFQTGTATKHQPAVRLHQAIVRAVKKRRAFESAFAGFSFNASAMGGYHGDDQRIRLGGHLLSIKVQCFVLGDSFDISRSAKAKFPVDISLPHASGNSLVKQAGTFLDDCIKLIKSCSKYKLLIFAVGTTLYYIRIVQIFGSSGLVEEIDRTMIGKDTVRRQNSSSNKPQSSVSNLLKGQMKHHR
jgi:hypothetical protein